MIQVTRYTSEMNLLKSMKKGIKEDTKKHGTSDGYMIQRIIPEVSKREESKVMKSIAKNGNYVSKHAQTHIDASNKKYEEYTKERSARCKREGISE